MEKIVKSTPYRGSELATTEWAMRFKLWVTVAMVCSAIQGVVFSLVATFLVGPKVMLLFGRIALAKLTGAGIANAKIATLLSHYSGRLLFAFIVSLTAYALAPRLLRYFRKKDAEAMAVEHVRGMRLLEEKALAEAVKNEDGHLPFGAVKLPRKYEPEHAIIIGKTRVGKSVCITQQVDVLRRENAKVVIYDFKGEYAERFFDPSRDFILNPLDERSEGWNVFSDLKTKADLTALCQSLIPAAKGEERYWNTAAQDVLRGVLAGLYAENRRTNSALWSALTSPIEQIAELCASTPSGRAGFTYIQDASSKQAVSVISVLMSFVSWLEFAPHGTFSIRNWLNRPDGGFIFLTGRPEVENTLRPLVSLFVDLLGKMYLSLPDDRERRVYFMLDEFGNLQQLPTVKRLLTAGGSKGAIVTIGIQDFAALKRIYGPEDAITIFNSCGTSLVLNLADPDTAEYLSKRFGDSQYWEAQETRSMGVEDGRDGISLQRQKRTERLILPSEIMQLPKLTGYLKLPEHDPAKIRLRIEPANNLPVLHPAFILRPGYELDDLQARDEQVLAAAAEAKASNFDRDVAKEATEARKVETETVAPERSGDAEADEMGWELEDY